MSALLVLAGWCGAGTALAQGQPLALPTLTYRAPSECPQRPEFERRLAARLASGRGLGTQPETRLHVRLERTKTVHGSIELYDARGLLGARQIEAHSCSEAVDALTFIAALLLEERARDAAAPRSATPPAAAQASENGTGAAAGSANAGTAASSTPRETATESAAQAPAAQVRSPRSAADELPREQSASGATARPARAWWDPQLALSGSLLVVAGVSPGVRPGLGAGVSLRLVRLARLALSLSLGLHGTLPESERSEDGTGRFRWWSSVLSLCADVPPRGALTGSLCASAALGQLLARGSETDGAASAREPFRALGPTARLRWQVAGPLILSPGVSALVPTTRPRFVVGASELFHVPKLTVVGELAVGMLFW